MTTHPLPPTRPAPIPRGVADSFWQEAQLRRTMVTRAIDFFNTWGYQEVIPPAFEYATTLDGRASPELASEIYRLVDRDGSSLALRADMTIPVARLVATRLHDVPMPQRFSYAGTVFRSGAGQAGLQREFWQAGVELIGASEAAADAEILAITRQALGALGVQSVRLAVGHHGYFEALITALELAPAARHALLDAVDRNSDAALAAFLRQTPLDAQRREVLIQLPHLNGSDTDAILARAHALSLNDAMRAAVANLAAILAVYAAFAPHDPVYLDLTEVHHLGYYTGLTFEALTPALGFPLASGGRYDQLVGSFGAPQPAVGAAILLDRVALALRSGMPEQPARPTPPVLLAGGTPVRPLIEAVEQMRAAGLRVQFDFRTYDGPPALWQEAQRLGAQAALFGEPDGRVRLIDPDGAHAAMSWEQLHAWRVRTPNGGAEMGAHAGAKGATHA